ncbi:MAG TPA: hypothetical protein VIB00_15480 [Pyrinomonadaceae bacterium]|jgi:hypothetical protein
MKLSEGQLKQILQQQSARSTARAVDCLTEDQFARAASGAMNKDERAKVARHLITCSDCTEEYRIIRSLKPWASDADQVLGAQVKSSQTPFWSNVQEYFWPSRTAFALGAMLFVLLLGGIWVIWNRQKQSDELARLNQQLTESEQALSSVQESLRESERRLTDLEESTRRQSNDRAPLPNATEANSERGTRDQNQPQLEVPIVDLDPSPVRGGSGSSGTVITVPETASSFTLILHFSGESAPRYEVEILDRRGREIWQGRVRERGESRSINLTLSRGLVTSGKYLIRLYALRGGGRDSIAEYPFEVRYR